MDNPDITTDTFVVKVQQKKTTGGHYLYINLPRKIEERLGLRKGDILLIKLKGNKLVIKKMS